MIARRSPMRQECCEGPLTTAMRRWGARAARGAFMSGLALLLATLGVLAMTTTVADAQPRTRGRVIIETHHTDLAGNIRLSTDEAGTPTAPVIDYTPFGEIIGASCNGGGDPTLSPKFQGKLRDPKTCLDDFGARDYYMVTGRFQSVDPVLPVETALRDPQQWNRYAYARNNPLIYTDPDGREVKPLDELALDRIRSTVPEHLRGAIVVGENGMLDKNALNAVETTDANFLDLRTLANLEGVAEVRTAASGSLVGMFFFRSAADTRKDLQQLGVRPTQEPVDSLALGDTTPSSNGALVTVSDGRHAASSAPAFEHAVTTAHELYVHALRMLQGKSWQHERAEPRGPVDTYATAVEARTRKLYGQQ